jgi:hypothetical protein
MLQWTGNECGRYKLITPIDERVMKMQEIKLQLTLAEVNQILEALSEKSNKEVFQLVSKIQAQATAQLTDMPAPQDAPGQA